MYCGSSNKNNYRRNPRTSKDKRQDGCHRRRRRMHVRVVAPYMHRAPVLLRYCETKSMQRVGSSGAKPRPAAVILDRFSPAQLNIFCTYSSTFSSWLQQSNDVVLQAVLLDMITRMYQHIALLYWHPTLHDTRPSMYRLTFQFSALA